MKEKAPIKGARLVKKAALMKCDLNISCIFCDYYKFCESLGRAYREAKDILDKEEKS